MRRARSGHNRIRTAGRYHVPVSGRRLRLLVAWGALLILGGSIYLGPYFAAWRIRQAVEAQDGEALHAWVDFEAVRANLKSELRRTMGASRRAREREQQEQPPAAEEAPTPLDSSSRLAVAVGEAMIDRFATPEGVDRALRGSEAASTGWDSFLNLGDGGGGNRVSVDAGYDGWSDFHVRLGVDADEPASEDEALWADILFERRGIWAWRVTGARVSPHAIPLLVN